MSDNIYNVLFLCTGNSARSIMAEAMLTVAGRGRFKTYSAGSHPTGGVHHFAPEQIEAIGYPLENLRSKSWNEFAGPDAPHMDFAITVCDKAAGEARPFWPGQPTNAHWAFQDRARVEGTHAQIRQALPKVCREIKTRLDIFQSLPIDKLDKLVLKREVDRIGEFKP